MSDLVLVVAGRRVRAHLASRDGEVEVRVGDREVRLRLEPLGPTTWRVTSGGSAQIVRTIEDAGTRWLHVDGATVAVRVEQERGRRFAARSEGLEAPMPGAVTRVAVRAGDNVAAGQPIVMIEAMKMEHVVRAPHDGRVLVLRVRTGQRVDAGTVVAELSPPPGEPRDTGGAA